MKAGRKFERGRNLGAVIGKKGILVGSTSKKSQRRSKIRRGQRNKV
jgi:hypothetical protein